MTATLLLAAHGTRDPAGVAVIHELAAAVNAQGVPTRVGFVDVLGPTPADVLREVAGPVVVVPAFLASGYHVRTDVPSNIAESGHADVTVTPAIGPDEALTRLVVQRLGEAGHRDGDAVVLAAAGSSDRLALADVATAAALVGAALGTAVTVGYVATARPTVAEVVARLRAEGAGRVAVAAYLLAPGLFHRRLGDLDVDVVGAPLGVDPLTVQLVLQRFHAARPHD